MSAPSSTQILRVPGTLIWNPTDLGQAEPYGGTYLGQVRDIEFAPQPKVRPILAEEWGANVDVVYCGERPLLRAVLRYPDSDAVSTAAFKAVASGSSGIRWLFRPGGTTENTRAGTSLFSRGGKLLFAARASSSHPFILLRNALPAFDEALKLQMSFGEEYGIALAFWAAPDSSGRAYDVALKSNLTL